MRLGYLLMAVLIVPSVAMAQHRITFEPSLDLIEVQDNNLNFSEDAPLHDQIRRATPELTLRFDSRRWSARSIYSFDSERYATHSNFDSARARQHAAIGIQYRAGSRVLLLLDASSIRTNTLADLNTDTGLSGLRLRARRLNVTSSARYRISPRWTVTASAGSTATTIVTGDASRTQVEAFAVEQRVNERNRLHLDYEHNMLTFSGETPQSLHSHVVLAGWTRDIGSQSSFSLRCGPRLSEGSLSMDVAASLTHRWRATSIAISVLRNQTTVVGYAGAVDMESAQVKFTYAPNRRFSAYAAPAIFQSASHGLDGTAYAAAAGARYAVTPLIGFDLAYNRVIQNGAIDPLRPDLKLSHATVSAGFSTHWNSDRYNRPMR